MSSRWLAAFIEAGGNAPIVTLPARAENAKKDKNTLYEPTKPTFGNSGNYGTYPKKQNIEKKISPYTSWDATDWQAFYDERAGIAEHDGRRPRSDAERIAYEACIAHWQNKNPPTHGDLAACPECYKALDRNPLAVLTGNNSHIWLHDRCHAAWLTRRRQYAIAALAGMGIVSKECGVL